jgi:hypothetical protein
MTFISLADASGRLGVDAKTLHRWLVDAQLALQSHPSDGRKKGVNEEHLLVLARLHHRRLAGGAQEVPPQLPALPADLLSLPEQLASMQAQLVTLQQQVAALTRLLTQPRSEPAAGRVLPKPPSTARPLAKRILPASHSRPAVKAPSPKAQVLPRVEYEADGRYVVVCPKKGVLPFEPDTPEWLAWVAEHDSFRFVGKAGYFTAHHEWRVKQGAWRAHRHLRNHSYTLRLAPGPQLTIAVLEQAAQALQAHLE